MGNSALNLAKRRGFPAMLLHVHLCTIPPNHEEPTCYRTNKLHQIYIYIYIFKKREREKYGDIRTAQYELRTYLAFQLIVN